MYHRTTTNLFFPLHPTKIYASIDTHYEHIELRICRHLQIIFRVYPRISRFRVSHAFDLTFANYAAMYMQAVSFIVPILTLNGKLY